ncbi:4-hydroxy-tetrahydrodipicolinate synthase [Sporanaerobium hydrogeniformans]|uniref:4-hydroxy-tetrahydrodipicolinate synthase n=1 Tax=Sporanaerobium hydrogeniformans TaxID=3072179 RepID=A0AC61DCF5_9FIRM|nr:4-hydroxy-tetrahydrodipicolinate synthase [Sporanaerobium hydrogeniformans]PHV70891.1 4-hydroxy-tetrahydrodipicolinate synthase [Sporanaerobium hydrogeniformans]
MTIFEGAGVAIVTPFHENGDIHFGKLEELIDFQIANSTDALIICGTTGEASTMTDAEHLECIKVAVDRVAGRIPVIAGTGSNDTRHGIELTKNAKALGADATLQVTPYYNKCTQRGLIEHFTAIAKAADLPMILYSVPSRTGVNITPQTALELSKIDLIVGLKEATGNISQVAEIAALCGDKLDLYSGNDDQIIPLLSLGGKGVISVLSNIAPKQTHDIVSLYLGGRTAEALKLQLELLPLANSLFCEVNPIPVKAALNMMGFGVGPCRLPLTTLEEAHAPKLREALVKASLIAE